MQGNTPAPRRERCPRRRASTDEWAQPQVPSHSRGPTDVAEKVATGQGAGWAVVDQNAKTLLWRAFRCAEEDSNLHPVSLDQALNLVTRMSYPSESRQIVRIVPERGRYGRLGRSGCCHGSCHGLAFTTSAATDAVPDWRSGDDIARQDATSRPLRGAVRERWVCAYGTDGRSSNSIAACGAMDRNPGVACRRTTWKRPCREPASEREGTGCLLRGRFREPRHCAARRARVGCAAWCRRPFARVSGRARPALVLQ